MVLKPIEVKAVDPLALILRGDIYVRIHLPDPPPDIARRVRTEMKTMSATERKAALQNAKTIAKYATAITEAAAAVERTPVAAGR